VTLTASDISFSYAPGRPVLRAVSVRLCAGAVTVIIGPNGAGKSTLLRILAGLARPASGSVALADRDLARVTHRQRARLLAYLPQRPSLAFAFTVRQVVGLGRYAAARTPGVIDRALAMVGLADRAGEPFGELSAGQQQRASLARALAQLDLDDLARSASGLALLADEPVSAMDPLQALRTMELLRAAAGRGLAVGVVLHDLSLAARFADRAVLLSPQGTVAAQGPGADVLRPEALAPVFGVGFRRLEDAASGAAALVPVGTRQEAGD
jgi:iron complex transport system ATP-binding protein